MSEIPFTSHPKIWIRMVEKANFKRTREKSYILESESLKRELWFSSISYFPTQMFLLGFTWSQQNAKALRHLALSRRFPILKFLSMPMYITSCLLFSSSFNKTYAVAVTKEETTKKQERVGSGTARSCTTRSCDCSAEQGRGRGMVSSWAMPRRV